MECNIQVWLSVSINKYSLVIYITFCYIVSAKENKNEILENIWQILKMTNKNINLCWIDQ